MSELILVIIIPNENENENELLWSFPKVDLSYYHMDRCRFQPASNEQDLKIWILFFSFSSIQKLTCLAEYRWSGKYMSREFITHSHSVSKTPRIKVMIQMTFFRSIVFTTNLWVSIWYAICIHIFTYLDSFHSPANISVFSNFRALSIYPVLWNDLQTQFYTCTKHSCKTWFVIRVQRSTIF